MVTMYLLATFTNSKVFTKLAQLFGMIFVLVLILNILFTTAGNPVDLGDISVPFFAIYFIFANMIFVNLPLIGNDEENEEVEKID